MTLLDHEIPTVLRINSTISDSLTVPVSTVYDATTSGTESIIVEIPIALTDHYTSNTETLFETSNALNVDKIDIEDEFVTQNTSIESIDLRDEVWQVEVNSSYNDIETDLFVYNNNLQTACIDSRTSFRINIGSIPIERDTFTELYLAEPKYFNIDTDLFCATLASLKYIVSDIQQQLGRINILVSDIYSSSVNTAFTEVDLYCVASSIAPITVDISTISGAINIINTDIYTVSLGVGGSTKVDIKTRSIFVNDFFLNVDEFVPVSSIGYVEVVDYLYPIDEAKTYIQKDGVTISGTYFEDIPNGKRLVFDVENTLYSNGEIILSLHAESSIGEILEEDFYLLYGYDLKLNEVVKWAPKQRVVVRGEASNLSHCPNKEGITYYFDTRDYQSYNLLASINPVVSEDLPVSIYPQSTTFFYNKTYTVRVVGVKDLQGNIMEPFYYTFTIENPSI